MAEVERTAEFRRILALQRRAPEAPEDLAEILTPLLADETKCPGAKLPPDPYTGLCSVCAVPVKLLPLQAMALQEIGVQGGAYLPLDVGEGKTLISLLAPYVLQARNVLLLLPAQLIKKTARERDRLSRHWLIPDRGIRMMSYQILGLVQSEHELETYGADLIVPDEAHKLKNRDAAVTRRVERYMDRHPETRMVAMTGTIMGKSLCDFAHVLRWCLKNGAPVPETNGELDEWALALDETLENEFCRYDPGALLDFATEHERRTLPPVVAARRGFQRRLRETPGVVSSASSGTKVAVPLTIKAITYDVNAATVEAFKDMHELGVLPGGLELIEAVDIWRHSKELALGFHQEWDPQPPEAWKQARKAWFSFVRGVLSHSRTYDSPEHVAQACDAGRFPADKLEAWRRIQPTFVPNPVPRWHDDSALKVCAEWMRTPGIVWTEHVEFALELARVTGAKYYGAKGLAADGQFVDDADETRSIIVSGDANREGRNLQNKWCRNLVTCPEELAQKWQQMIGRTHRTGQTRAVTVDVLLGCHEHARAWAKAVANARSVRDLVGSHSKLLAARVQWPDTSTWTGPRWER